MRLVSLYAKLMNGEVVKKDEEGAYNLLSAEEIRDYALSHGITKDTTVIMYSGDGDNRWSKMGMRLVC